MAVRVLEADSAVSETAAGDAGPLVIGLVNNMPDAAIRVTERQFVGLLGEASGDVDVLLQLYHLPDTPRSDAARELFLSRYRSVEDLPASRVDALIVTGAEPRADHLAGEPYWSNLSGLIDWARENTVSTIWSCLAAHAAVLRLDGIERRELSSKISGVYRCAKVSEDPLLAGAPPEWTAPHSRRYDLPSDALLARGYTPLTRASTAGTDMFVKDFGSRFIFFQGHLEYDATSLLREYVRDIVRFLDGQQNAYPGLPHDYLDEDAARAFAEVEAEALAGRNARPLAALAAHLAEQRVANVWRPAAQTVYRNWLRLVDERKIRSAGRPVRPHG